MAYTLETLPDVYHRGDTRPPLRARLVAAESGDPLPLDDATRITVSLHSRTSTVVETRGTVDEETDQAGWVVCSWSRSELDLPPRAYAVSVSVRFDDGDRVTAPTSGRVYLTIEE